MKKMTIKKMVLISAFGALSGILYFLKFPLPALFPGFLEINFSMLPVIICAFLLGPLEGLGVVLIRFVIKLVIISTHTAGVGEIADLILGSTTVLACGFSYKYIKCKHRDIFALLITILTWVVVGILSNWLYSVPAYINLYFGGNTASFIGACSIIPGIDASNYMLMYLLVAVLPFNLLISLVVCLVTYFVNKRLSPVYEMFN